MFLFPLNSRISRHLLLAATLTVPAATLAAQPPPAQPPPAQPTPARPTPPNPPSITFTFEDALEYAQEHYPAVRAAIEQVNAAQAGVRGARSTSLPRLDATWQINRATANNVFGQVLPQSVIPAMSGPVLASATADNVWGSAVGGLLTWEPVDLGLRAATIREADEGLAQARADEAVTRLTVQGAVGAAFLTVVGAEQVLAAAEADVQRREVLSRAAHVLVDNQLRPGAEASRADAERAASQTRAIQARRAAAEARLHLAQMLGVTTGSVVVNGAPLLNASPPATADDASTPLAHPAVRQKQAAVDLSLAREATLERTDRPRLLLQSALFARGTGANPDGHLDKGLNGLGPERANWTAGAQVVFPNLFDVASRRARHSAAAAETRVESARRDEAVLAVTTQQQIAEVMVEAAAAVAQNTPIQLAAARQSESQARARYDAGLAGIVEVAESQGLLATAESQHALALVEVWRALLAQAVARGTIAPLLERARASGVQ